MVFGRFCLFSFVFERFCAFLDVLGRGFGSFVINNASNEYHRELVFDAPARMVGRFENFLRDVARSHAPCCGKVQRIVLSAIFKTFFKNARIGTRTHAGEEWSQRGSNPRGEREPL